MTRFLLLALALLLSAGCATTGKPETPQSVAAKSLLSARQGVIAAASTADALCSSGRLSQAQCDRARELYTQAQAAYLFASDAFMVVVNTPTDSSWSMFHARQEELLRLFRDIDALAAQFGAKGVQR